MTFGTRNQAAEARLTVTRPTARKAGRWVRWTRRMKAEFLDALAGSCNVGAAAAAIGVDPASVYALRRRDPEFLREWGIALETGYQMLETFALGHVLAGAGRLDPIDMPDTATLLHFEEALRLLAHHRAAGERSGQRSAARGTSGPRPQRALTDETDAAILKKLAAIEKRRGAA